MNNWEEAEEQRKRYHAGDGIRSLLTCIDWIFLHVSGILWKLLFAGQYMWILILAVAVPQVLGVILYVIAEKKQQSGRKTNREDTPLRRLDKKLFYISIVMFLVFLIYVVVTYRMKTI